MERLNENKKIYFKKKVNERKTQNQKILITFTINFFKRSNIEK